MENHHDRQMSDDAKSSKAAAAAPAACCTCWKSVIGTIVTHILLCVTSNLLVTLGPPINTHVIRGFMCVNMFIFFLLVVAEFAKLFPSSAWYEAGSPEAHAHVMEEDTAMTIAEMKRFRHALDGLRREIRRRRRELDRED